MRAPIEGHWTAAIVEVLPGCGVQAGDACTVLAESRSRPVLPLPAAGRVGGSLVLDRGDVNLTFKRCLQRAVRLMIEDDPVTDVIGDSPDAESMRGTFAACGERAAYAVPPLGWDLPLRGCTVDLDGLAVVRAGVLA